MSSKFSIPNKLTSLLRSTGNRNLELFRNIVYSFFIKLGIAVIGLALVPLNLTLLSQTNYGVWLTVSSLTTWFYFFDIGLANGLRNKFTQSVTQEDYLSARIYLSTTYAIISLLVLIVLLVFYSFRTVIDWNQLFNTNIKATTIDTLVQLTVLMLALKLVLSVITTTLIAYHKIRISNFIELLSSLGILFATYFAIQFAPVDIVLVGIINTAIPVLVLLIASVILFASTLKAFKPSLKMVDFNLSGQLFNKGIQFFILQLAGMFILVVNQLLIARLFDPAEVTVYTIVSKYFSIPLLGFAIVIVPFWTSFSEAFHKQELLWIQKSVKNLMYTWLMVSIGLCLMVFIFPMVLNIWIKTPIVYDYKLTIYFAIFVMLSNFGNLFNQFNNALDKLRIQLYCALFMILFHIPLSIYLCRHYLMGIEGIMLSACICLLPGTILSAIQYHLIVQNKAKGVWLK